MLKFYRLIVNEWFKMSKKRSFFIAYAIMLAGVAGFALLIHTMNGEKLPTALEFADAILGRNGLGQILTLLSIIFTAGTLAKEYQLGTIKFLLIRGHSRSIILSSKYVTVILFVLSLTAFTLAAAVVTGWISFGFGDEGRGWADVAQTVLYQTIYTLIYVTLAFMFGVLTKSTGATIGIGITAVLMEGLMNMLLSKYEFYKYLLFMNADLSAYADGGMPAEGMTVAFSSFISAAYVVLFLIISFVTFKKRDIA